MNSETAAAAPRRRRRKLPGWIPDQHGAWAMVTIPALSGVALAGFTWEHLPLLALWWVGYFFYNALTVWLRSRRREKYLAPVRTYGLGLVPFAAVLAVTKPYLAIWILAYAPLIAVSLWLVGARRERSLLNDSITVFAACLMGAVTFHANAAHGDARWGWTILVLTIQFAYFWGTIPHVKALIRERNRPEAARRSVLYHGIVAAAILTLTLTGILSEALWEGWFLVATWLLLTLRASAMPRLQRETKPLRPMTIGLTEVAFSLIVAAGTVL